MNRRTFLATLAALLMAAGAAQAAPTTVSPDKPTLYIIGDSTVKNGTKGLQGWGDPIAQYFDPAKITVENDARGGRSSRTFLTEGLWGAVLAKLKPGDFVLMQFGHNDGGSVHSGYRASLKGMGSETESVTDAKTGKAEDVHSFGWYMTQYVTDTKAKGATPIVLSLIPRDDWTAGKVNRSGADNYGGWAADVAKAQNVPFIDLNAITADKYDPMGFDAVKAAFFPGDHTHTNPAGATVNAQSVVSGIKGLTDCTLKSDLSPAADALPAAPQVK